MAETMRVRPGQLLMVGLPAPVLDRSTRAFLKGAAIGGVVLFRRNVGEVAALAALTAELHALLTDRPILVAIDHEGGRVSRLGEPFTQFPPAAVVGRAASPHLAYRQGVAMGEELRSVGIDIDFAPVLDVASNPRNPVIGDRSFGGHPRTVSRLGISVAHGLQRTGVISCGKHFPGHGDTDRDSHLELPIVRRSQTEIERTELFPFRRAIQSGMTALMTAHVLFPALDPSRPATLSRAILTDLLRERLRFRGVVFSDDLEMKAIADRYGPDEAAILALEAGVDWLLFCSQIELAERALQAIERAAPKRPRLAARLEEAAARTDALRRAHLRRRRYPQVYPPIPPEGFANHRNLVRWIVERGAQGGRSAPA
ncbi:MAG: beta-N-acetylhexosaminidase [Deltaproteobacteria bacterium]|nr:beta-N-acetylhexosaminidase [Deltaproteobacteria bacterium]